MIRIKHLVTRDAVREPGKGGAESRNIRDESYDITLDGHIVSVSTKAGGKFVCTKVPLHNVVCFEEMELKVEGKK